MFVLPELKKIVLVSNARKDTTYVIHRHDGTSDWKNFSDLNKNQMRALQLSANNNVDLVETFRSQQITEWREKIRATLAKPSFSHESLDVDQIITDQKFEEAPPGYLSEGALFRKINLGYERLRKEGINAVAIDRGLDDPKLLYELWLDGSGNLEYFLSPDAIKDIIAKFPEKKERRLGKKWLTLNKLCNKLRKAGLPAKPEDIEPEIDNYLDRIEEAEGEDYKQEHWAQYGAGHAVTGETWHYHHKLYIMIKEQLMAEKASRKPKQPNTYTKKNMILLLREEGIKGSRAKFSDTFEQIVRENKDDPDFQSEITEGEGTIQTYSHYKQAVLDELRRRLS